MALFSSLCHAAPLANDPDMKACRELEADKAIAACDRVLQANPLSREREIEARDMLGVNQTNTARFDDAIANFTRVIALDSKKSGAYSSRGVAYANKKDFDKAFADFSTALKLNPKNAVAYFERCDLNVLQKKYELALSDCDKLVSLRPAVGLAWATRARVHLLQHDSDLAIADLNKAIRLDPKNSRFYWARAMAYSQKREDAKAVADDLTAAQLEPDDWRILSSLSSDLLIAHREDGLAIFDGLVHKHPQAAAPYYFRGQAYEQEKKLKEAIADLGTYIRLRPEDARGYSLHGTYLEEAGEYGKASSDFGQAIEREKQPRALAAAYENRCVSTAEAGIDLGAGIADCNRALHMDEGRWEAYNGRGFAEFRQEKYAAARADFDKRIAVQIEPEDLVTAAEQSIANFLTGRAIDDISYFRGSILGTELAMAFCGRGLTKTKMGDTRGANDDLATAEKLDADSVAKCKRVYGAAR